MGRFVNPDNSAFQVALNSPIYVDKTGLLEYTNSVLNTTEAYICNSRPRRFGKSYAANMLAAYYSKGCDSEEMFSGLDISRESDFKIHLNKYDVIQLDIQWFMANCDNVDNIVAFITKSVQDELREIYPDIFPDGEISLSECLSRIKNAVGQKFIVIIDEWDVLIRDEAANKKVQEKYINFLRAMFKGTEPTKYIQLAYLTGILPIKKEKTQSALNNFDEFTMLDAGVMAPYIGFTEAEVKNLCERYHRDFEKVKYLYTSYLLGDYQVYNPEVIIDVCMQGKFRSYWSETGTYETINPLINMDFDGLKTVIIEMLSGADAEVDVRSFRNDIIGFANKDDVITYLIHLGHLGYNSNTRKAFIPNEEAVAEEIEKIHMEYISDIKYNKENSLSSVLAIAYLSSMEYYFKPVLELPTGRGFTDFVFLPKPEYISSYPALVVELKWNKSAKTALQQIKERKYPESIKQYTGDILLVGVNYDKKTKKHLCLIESYEKKEKK